MDRLTEYRSIVKRILAQHAERIPSIGQVESASIFDDQSGNYALLDMGWDPTGRVHAVVIHLRLDRSKVWIEADNTEEGVADELVAAGVPPQDIVLAFYRPERRRLSEFAVA
jgi:hypothetical protein